LSLNALFILVSIHCLPWSITAADTLSAKSESPTSPSSILDSSSEASAQEQDWVTYRRNPNAPPRTIKGSIVDFNSRLIVIKVKEDLRRIGSEQIMEIRTGYLESHHTGDDLKKRNEFLQAAKMYTKALDDEPRPWVKRKILAGLTACYREEGLWLEATSAFEKILESDSETRFFVCIPLAWTATNPDANRDQEVSKWLADGDSSEVRRLIAASLLLTGSQSGQASRELAALSISKNKNISQLATLQSWRTRMLSTDGKQILRWQNQLETFPSRLRYGGFFVIGMAYAQQQNEKSQKLAITKLMRLPINYSSQHQLAAASLHKSHQILKSMNDERAAQTILQELARSYSDTPFGKNAIQQLEK